MGNRNCKCFSVDQPRLSALVPIPGNTNTCILPEGQANVNWFQLHIPQNPLKSNKVLPQMQHPSYN